jgi:hypothetical protein
MEGNLYEYRRLTMKRKGKKFNLLSLVIISILFIGLFTLPSFVTSYLPGDFVGPMGDPDPDGKVDFNDLMVFATAYGSEKGETNWNPLCDICGYLGDPNPDDKVNFDDLMLFATNYGKECPSEEGILEVVSAQIDLEVGGVVEVTDEASEIYGTRLVINPISKERQVNIRGLSEITILLNAQVLGTNKLDDSQGWIITPVGVISTLDILGLIRGRLEISYNEKKLSNSGVAKNSIPNVYRVKLPIGDGYPWEKVPDEKITHETDKVKIEIGLGDLNYLYTLTVTNCKPPDPDDLGTPLPGDLVYRLSEVGVNDNWIPGHVGIYVGERYGDHDKDPSTPDKVYNVIEALGGPSGPNSVLGNLYPDITKFGGDQYVYMGAREPEYGLLHSQRNKIIAFAEAAKGSRYALFDTVIGIYIGLARGNHVKGPDYNCVGLAEAAYEYGGVDLVSNDDEGNDSPFLYQDAILSPQEQLFRTVPASGIMDQNTAPVISSLEMVPENPALGSWVTITCHATDQDQDILSYEWTVPNETEPIIRGKQLDFQVPSVAGDYQIECRVFDNYGGEDMDSIGLSEQEILTPEEIELIREWGYGGDYVIRWPDGYVDVYDETNYSRMQEVINEWNAAISGPVILRLSGNSNSPVKVIFDWSLEEESFCGRYYNRWENYTFSEAVIKINPYCESYNYPLYLSMFNAVAGFNFWAEVSPCPFETWSNFNIIPDMIRKMVHALHKVYPGYYLGESKLKINQTSTVTEDMQSNAKGGCAANCRK